VSATTWVVVGLVLVVIAETTLIVWAIRSALLDAAIAVVQERWHAEHTTDGEGRA
jgi:hypothetical protein